MQRSHFVSITIAAVLLVGSAWLILSNVTGSPKHVFDDMLRNNLSTPGVTRLVAQDNQGVDITQYTQLSLGARPQAHSLTILKQGGGTLATEEIGTADTDLVRYQKIVLPGGGSSKVSKVVGKWATLAKDGAGSQTGITSQLFKQSLAGILPIANLSPDDRGALLGTIHSTNVFRYNSAAVKKTDAAGRAVYRYQVQLKSSAYITMMQQFEKLIDQDTFKDIDPKTYATASPIGLQIDIDRRSHQLVQVYQIASNRTETYKGFGLTDNAPLPKANITTTELTKLLASGT